MPALTIRPLSTRYKQRKRIYDGCVLHRCRQWRRQRRKTRPPWRCEHLCGAPDWESTRLHRSCRQAVSGISIVWLAGCCFRRGLDSCDERSNTNSKIVLSYADDNLPCCSAADSFSFRCCLVWLASPYMMTSLPHCLKVSPRQQGDAFSTCLRQESCACGCKLTPSGGAILDIIINLVLSLLRQCIVCSIVLITILLSKLEAPLTALEVYIYCTVSSTLLTTGRCSS